MIFELTDNPIFKRIEYYEDSEKLIVFDKACSKMEFENVEKDLFDPFEKSSFGFKAFENILLKRSNLKAEVSNSGITYKPRV